MVGAGAASAVAATVVMLTCFRSITSPLTFFATTTILWDPAGTLSMKTTLASVPFTVFLKSLSRKMSKVGCGKLASPNLVPCPSPKLCVL
ncbi:MAG: hypothetical protein DMF54_01845 [Acidobacteria bacterium]|nr:MAG: hypothetical protein DMF55_00490 [Acidobacteriota bacterium]PYQ68122.1 MAG: hypothetical protein DMF54_01845 [Acidobacteriota bacterium]